LSGLVAYPGVRSSGVAAKSYRQRSGSATMATVKAITSKTFDSFCPGLQAPVFGIGKTAYLLNVCHPLLTITSDHILDELDACAMDSDAYEAESDEAKRRDVPTNFDLAF
jgi:hypothetical protein